uniref:Integrase catalytic domain-containing protein n=1 Tax=Amphimedon queenslandica TaxID=400682 RepID=A0A1X7TNT6_AMPQE
MCSYRLVNPQWTLNERKPSCNTKETPEGGTRLTPFGTPRYFFLRVVAKEAHFNNITSSHRYAQANGEAERAVQIVKELLSCSKEHYSALLAYGATPLNLGYSPAELLIRRHWTTVAVSFKQLKPNIPN